MARVRLNGTDLGVVWTAPWRVEITRAAKPKGNKLEIEVVNVWLNRMIADEDLPPEKRFTRLNSMFFRAKKGPLLPSGLLGPVRLLATETGLRKAARR